MSVYRVTIPGWRPALLNEYLTRHWSVGATRKKKDKKIIAASLLAARVPRAKGPRRVSLHATLGPRQRAYDEDAPWKSLLDALVRTGYLVDDTARWRKPGTLTFGRGPQMATTIILEEVQC